MKEINPYVPGVPVPPDLHAGRVQQIKTLQRIFRQAGNNNRHQHPLIIGEIGLGKTSLLDYMRCWATSQPPFNPEGMDFVAVNATVKRDMNLGDLVSEIQFELERSLNDASTLREIITKGWEFVSRVQYFGNGLQPRDSTFQPRISHLAHILDHVLEHLTSPLKCNLLGFTSPKSGLAIFIDEVDKAHDDLHIGTFMKDLLERLNRNSHHQIIITLAGLPKALQVINNSHTSVLRSLEIVRLEKLTLDESSDAYKKPLEYYNSTTRYDKIGINYEALRQMHKFSEGYPHFVQQIGKSVFEQDRDNYLDIDDVDRGMFGDDGAIHHLGTAYYYDWFYEQVKSDDYRTVLEILALEQTPYSDSYVSRSSILSRFKKFSEDSNNHGKIVDNALRVLKEKGHILLKEGNRGMYRIYPNSYARWILYETKRKNLRQGF